VKSRIAVIAVGAAVLFGIVTVPSEYAMASSVPPAQSTAHYKPVPHQITRGPDTTYFCKFTAYEPFKLTARSSTLYAQSAVTECSDPRPTGCHMTVDLQELKEIGGIGRWETIAVGDKGWVACATSGKASVTQASYKCQSILNDYPFRNQSILAIEFPGGHAVGNPATSSSVSEPCE
jgi:hypothetical protein